MVPGIVPGFLRIVVEALVDQLTQLRECLTQDETFVMRDVYLPKCAVSSDCVAYFVAFLNVNYSGKNRRLKNFKLEVWGERLKGDRQAFQSYQKNYPTGRTAKGSRKSGYVLFSVASTSNAGLTGRIYRRACAYVLDGDATKIYFMEVPSDYS